MIYYVMRKEKDTISMGVRVIQFIFALLMITMICFSFVGCGTTQVLAEKETIEKIVVKDSLIYRDSIVYIPQERIVEIVPQLDTLFMEIETAESKAYLDTTNMLLKGELKSKKKEVVKYQTIIEYRDRIDTVYIKEPQPYEVEVIKYKRDGLFWYLLAFQIVVILILAVRVYLKFKK